MWWKTNHKVLICSFHTKYCNSDCISKSMTSEYRTNVLEYINDSIREDIWYTTLHNLHNLVSRYGTTHNTEMPHNDNVILAFKWLINDKIDVVMRILQKPLNLIACTCFRRMFTYRFLPNKRYRECGEVYRGEYKRLTRIDRILWQFTD